MRHGFTHFELEIEVYVAQLAKRPETKGQWIAAEKLGAVALPTVMRKIIEHGGRATERRCRYSLRHGLRTAQTSSARKR